MNTNKPRILSKEEGNPLWYLNGMVNIKLSAADTGGQFSWIDEILPVGSATPYHIHHQEDETFAIIDGEAEFVLDGRLIHARTGALLFLPRNIPHGFRIVGDRPAHVINLVTPGGFEQMFIDAGEPAATLELPPPTTPDIAKVIEAAKKLNIEILGTLDMFINNGQ